MQSLVMAVGMAVLTCKHEGRRAWLGCLRARCKPYIALSHSSSFLEHCNVLAHWLSLPNDFAINSW